MNNYSVCKDGILIKVWDRPYTVEDNLFHTLSKEVRNYHRLLSLMMVFIFL